MNNPTRLGDPRAPLLTALGALALGPFLAGLAACSASNGSAGQGEAATSNAATVSPATPENVATMPQGAVVLGAVAIPELLQQCSRGAPAAGESSWQPGAADIAALEAALPDALAKAAPKEDWTGVPGRWGRQYVGLVRGNRHYIYGNFFPLDHTTRSGITDQNSSPIIVCDGGPVFFGVEFDPAAATFTEIDFNGVA